MKKGPIRLMHSRGIVSPVLGGKGTFRSTWQSYCAHPKIRYFDIPLFRRAYMNALARLKLRHVHHVTFEQLSLAGYDIQTFDDGASPLEPEKDALRELPGHWKIPQTVIAPKIAKLRDAVLFGDGSALLPDDNYCFFDMVFASNAERRVPREFSVPLPIHLHTDPVTGSALIRRHMPSISMPGRYFSVLRKRYRYFAHFVHDILSSIYYEDLGVIFPGRDKVIVSESITPLQEAIFCKVFEGYEIVRVPSDVALRVDELLLPANLCKRDTLNPAAFAALARRMRRIMAPYSGKEKYKVCVSRKDSKRNRATGREFANTEAYEALMRKLGYRVLNVSEIDVNAQFALWANTTDIVGIHGSGMMNMIMMPSGGNYCEIVPMPANSNQPWLCPVILYCCAMAAGHRTRALSGAVNEQGRPEVNLDRLEALLHEVLSLG